MVRHLSEGGAYLRPGAYFRKSDILRLKLIILFRQKSNIHVIFEGNITAMREYGFSLTRILPCEDRIVDSIFIRENIDQWQPAFSHILCSAYEGNNTQSVQKPLFKKKNSDKCT